MFELSTRFPYGLMYLVLEDDPELPDIDGIANTWRTSSMIAHAVLHDAEGEVHFRVSESPPKEGMILLFQDVLYSHRLKLEVWNVYIDSLATFQLEAKDFTVRMWGDDPRESSEVHIQFLSGNPALVV